MSDNVSKYELIHEFVSARNDQQLGGVDHSAGEYMIRACVRCITLMTGK